MKSAHQVLSAVQAGYDRWSLVYDHDANPLPALEQPVVREWTGNVSGLAALDLGCGTGRHAIWLAQAGAEVTAVDFSEGMLAEAREKQGSDRIEYVQHDLHQPLPFDAGTFDVLVSGLVLEHIHDLHAFFAECHRVLKPDGRIIVSAMHPAMFLRGSQARFTDPDSGEIVQPGSLDHSLSDMLMSGILNDLRLAKLSEIAPDHAFARQYPRATKYVDYPMLAVMQFQKERGKSS